MTVRRVVVDHVGLLVRDLGASRRFYEVALATLGFALLEESENGAAFGVEGVDDFGIHRNDAPTTGAQVAFVAKRWEAVDPFHAAALAGGERDKSPPAPRAESHPGYDAAYVWDPDGNTVEAVFHDRSPTR